MMTRIDSPLACTGMTRDQRDRLTEFRDRWTAIGLAAGPTDRFAAEAAVRRAYRSGGLEPPVKFLWLASPAAGLAAAHAVAARGLGCREILVRVPRPCLAEVEAAFVETFGMFPEPPIGEKEAYEKTWFQLRTAAGIAIPEDFRLDLHADLVLRPRRRAASLLRERVATHVLFDIHEKVGRPAAERILADCQRPVELALLINMSRPNPAFWDWLVPESGVRDFAQGQHEAGWLSVFDFCAEVLGVDVRGPLEGLLRAAQSCGWWWPFRGVAVLSERPVRIARDDQRRLHREDGPAIEYGDGWGLYRWHGVTVPEKVILRPESITLGDIRGEENIEVRRILIERYGMGRYLRETGRLLQGDSFGELYRIEGQEGNRTAMVRVVNSTPEPDGTRKEYFLRVPASVRTARAGVAWTFGLGADDYVPVLET